MAEAPCAHGKLAGCSYPGAAHARNALHFHGPPGLVQDETMTQSHSAIVPLGDNPDVLHYAMQVEAAAAVAAGAGALSPPGLAGDQSRKFKRLQNQRITHNSPRDAAALAEACVFERALRSSGGSSLEISAQQGSDHYPCLLGRVNPRSRAGGCSDGRGGGGSGQQRRNRVHRFRGAGGCKLKIQGAAMSSSSSEDVSGTGESTTRSTASSDGGLLAVAGVLDTMDPFVPMKVEVGSGGSPAVLTPARSPATPAAPRQVLTAACPPQDADLAGLPCNRFQSYPNSALMAFQATALPPPPSPRPKAFGFTIPPPPGLLQPASASPPLVDQRADAVAAMAAAIKQMAQDVVGNHEHVPLHCHAAISQPYYGALPEGFGTLHGAASPACTASNSTRDPFPYDALQPVPLLTTPKASTAVVQGIPAPRLPQYNPMPETCDTCGRSGGGGTQAQPLVLPSDVCRRRTDAKAREQGCPSPLSPGAASPGGSRSQRERRFTCKFVFAGFDIDRDADFELVPRLIGRGGANMRDIAEACDGKVRIRGRGSGHREQQRGSHVASEADVPLQIALSCKDMKCFQEGRKRLVALLEFITMHFQRYCRRKGVDPAPPLYSVVGSA